MLLLPNAFDEVNELCFLLMLKTVSHKQSSFYYTSGIMPKRVTCGGVISAT